MEKLPVWLENENIQKGHLFDISKDVVKDILKIEKYEVILNFGEKTSDYFYEIIKNHNVIISDSVYEARTSAIQFQKILSAVGRNDIKGLTYYSLTGDYLTKCLNLNISNIKHVENLVGWIKAVSNNDIFEVSYEGKFKVYFDNSEGLFKSEKLIF